MEKVGSPFSPDVRRSLAAEPTAVMDEPSAATCSRTLHGSRSSAIGPDATETLDQVAHCTWRLRDEGTSAPDQETSMSSALLSGRASSTQTPSIAGETVKSTGSLSTTTAETRGRVNFDAEADIQLFVELELGSDPRGGAADHAPVQNGSSRASEPVAGHRRRDRQRPLIRSTVSPKMPSTTAGMETPRRAELRWLRLDGDLRPGPPLVVRLDQAGEAAPAVQPRHPHCRARREREPPTAAAPRRPAYPRYLPAPDANKFET